MSSRTFHLALAFVASVGLAGTAAADEQAKKATDEHAEHAMHAGHADHAMHAQHAEATPETGDMSSKHDFSDAERWAKVFDDPQRLAWQKPQEVVNLMKIEPGMQVADLGAGTGFFLGYLAAAVGKEGKVLGLDPEPNMVDFMKKKAIATEWTQVDAKVIPFDSPGLEPASTDRILIVDTWHHIEDRVNYAKKLAAVLKEDGAVYVVDFTPDSPVGPHKDHRISHQKVMEELKEGGFEVELLEETLPYQYLVKAAKPCSCNAAKEE